eukprot:5732281-Prymnesium_polylepis.1
MGHVDQVPEEIELLRGAVIGAVPPVQHVCQVGHNAGHSGVTMIDGLGTTLASFDLFSLPYSKASQDFIAGRYPNRVSYYRGRSQNTIRAYAEEVAQGRAPLCDLWFIDGDHWHGALLDMKAALTVSRDAAVIIADDCTARHTLVMSAWRTMVSGGFIVDDFNRSYSLPSPAGLKGWCVGRYRKRDGDAAELKKGFEGANRLSIDPISGAALDPRGKSWRRR